jgi:baseplate J-like protein
MDAEPQLLYLEPDDEITSVIRRLRGADAGRVVLVAPGRSRATSSVVALRLLARAAADTGRSVALVADASTRALAGEAGVAAFASVADATSPNPAPAEPMTPTRAPIHVVRGAGGARTAPPKPAPATDGMEETVAVHLPPPVTRGTSRRGRRGGVRLPAWPLLAVLLVVALVAGAALLPGATVRITPATSSVTPQSFPVTTDITGRVTATLQATTTGTATGTRPELTPASGVVTFFNWNTVAVDVPQGTQVSVDGTTAFVTLERVVVPRGKFGAPITPGEKSVQVAAVVPGEGGNVAAGAINTVDNATVRQYLRGFPENPNRLVNNAEPTSGGLETTHPVVQQSDIDAAVAAVQADLEQQLSDALGDDADRIYADPPDSEAPSIEVPDTLLGTEDTPTFELAGTLEVNRPYGSRADLEETAKSAMLALGGGGTETVILEDSIAVTIRGAAEVDAKLQVQVTATARQAVRIDEAQVRGAIVGKTVEEAKAALQSLGAVAIDLWPGWVDRLPALDFRITIVQSAQAPGESPPASGSSTSP